MTYRVRGFRFGAVASGIKKSGLDLAVIAADQPCSAAAVFTRNRVKAAPVRLSRSLLSKAKGKIQAVVVNSGNANACTGRTGLVDARRMGNLTAEALGVPAGRVLVASTGVIGQALPMDRIEPGIEKLGGKLAKDRFEQFADGILTTDRGRKTARRTMKLGGKRVTLIGCTKGAGMIAPNMATTLSFVVTDARVSPATLDKALTAATTSTFNAITVDGDTSTNDMILVMAGGAADNRSPRGKEAARFTEVLTDLLGELARKLMRDGEGVHHVVTLQVRGARSDRAAQKIARTVANSPLVKTAIAGRDPNWGRIMGAIGNAGVPIKADAIDLWIERVELVTGGQLTHPDRDAQAAKAMKAGEYTITIDMNDGDGAARYLACDLSHEYVSINADYRS
jgi:glutamate N-acetyltransferase/amino-acid N-acetyltransferase